MKMILLINPMTPIINAYRDILFYKQMPNMLQLGGIVVISLVILSVGLVVFKKLQRGFAEEL